MKKLINDPRAVVDESVEGFGLAHADLVTVFGDPEVHRPKRCAGGQARWGSFGRGERERAGARGIRGGGMLDAAVAGQSSPRNPDRCGPAALAVTPGRGRAHREELHRRRPQLRPAAELAAAEGLAVAHGPGRRRRRGADATVHRGRRGRGRHHARGEGRRRGRRGAATSSRTSRPWVTASTRMSAAWASS